MNKENLNDRWADKVRRQEAEIGLLREKLLGLVQTQRCCEALVAALLVAAGADQDHPLEVHQEDIQAAMDGRYRAETDTDPEGQVHRLRFREIREG